VSPSRPPVPSKYDALSPRRSQRKRKSNSFYSSPSPSSSQYSPQHWDEGQPHGNHQDQVGFAATSSLRRGQGGGGISDPTTSRGNKARRRKPLFASQDSSLPPRHGVPLTPGPKMIHSHIHTNSNPPLLYSPMSPRSPPSSFSSHLTSPGDSDDTFLEKNDSRSSYAGEPPFLRPPSLPSLSLSL
jgi:hypothetical protein